MSEGWKNAGYGFGDAAFTFDAPERDGNCPNLAEFLEDVPDDSRLYLTPKQKKNMAGRLKEHGKSVWPELETLTVAELDELSECEQIIRDGLNVFLAVGSALLRIRDARLYRASHSSFEAYCADRWSLARNRACQFIEAAGVVQNVQNFGHQPPQVESQARMLAKLPPEEQAEAWAEVLASGKATAKRVGEIVQRRLGKRWSKKQALAKAERTLDALVKDWPANQRAALAELLMDRAKAMRK